MPVGPPTSAPRLQFAHLMPFNIPQRTPQSILPPPSQWASRLSPDVALHKRPQKSTLQNPCEAGGALQADKGIKEGILEVLYLPGSHISACFPDSHNLESPKGRPQSPRKARHVTASRWRTELVPYLLWRGSPSGEGTATIQLFSAVSSPLQAERRG